MGQDIETQGEEQGVIRIRSLAGVMLYEGKAETAREAVVAAVASGAYLRGADLRGAYLRGAYLRGADLGGADLGGADLRGAYLGGAYLGGADLGGADLRGAYLRGAHLRGADLGGADLRGAYLGGAYLSGAGISLVDAARLSIVPEAGAFEGWKQCRDGVLVRLEIPADARRSNATGRKCRAERARVLEVVGDEEGVSLRRPSVVYRVGETVSCDEWCEDRWRESAGGIHFYITKAEAEAHV